MKEDLFVSVVIPTFNRSLYLVKALESVKNQTHQNFECIIIDDGSTDDTHNIVSSINDSRFFYHHQQNKGVSSARNLGLKKMKSKWVCLLDSDDIWHPEKLKTQIEYIQQNPNVRILQTEEIWIRNGKRVNPKKKHKKYSGWIFNECIALCIVSPSAVMIHQEVFDKVGFFDENMPACEDYDLWLRVALEFPIITLNKALITKFGGHTDQLSQKYWGMDRFRIYALEKILKNPKLTKEQRDKVEDNLDFRYKILNQGSQKRGKIDYEKI